MLSRPFKLPDVTGAVVILLSSFLIWLVTPVPRMMCLLFLMQAIWGHDIPPDHVIHGLYFAIEGLSCLITGIFVMFACRALVPGAGRGHSLVLAVIVSCMGAMALVLLRQRLTVPFFLSPWDLAVQVPGWVLGYLVTALRPRPAPARAGRTLPPVVLGAIVLTLLLAMTTPLLFTMAPVTQRVDATFQPVPPTPAPAPAPANSSAGPAAANGAPPFQPVPAQPQDNAYAAPQNAEQAAGPYGSSSLVPPPIVPNSTPTPVPAPP